MDREKQTLEIEFGGDVMEKKFDLKLPLSAKYVAALHTKTMDILPII